MVLGHEATLCAARHQTGVTTHTSSAASALDVARPLDETTAAWRCLGRAAGSSSGVTGRPDYTGGEGSGLESRLGPYSPSCSCTRSLESSGASMLRRHYRPWWPFTGGKPSRAS